MDKELQFTDISPKYIGKVIQMNQLDATMIY